MKLRAAFRGSTRLLRKYHVDNVEAALSHLFPQPLFCPFQPSRREVVKELAEIGSKFPIIFRTGSYSWLSFDAGQMLWMASLQLFWEMAQAFNFSDVTSVGPGFRQGCHSGSRISTVPEGLFAGFNLRQRSASAAVSCEDVLPIWLRLKLTTCLRCRGH